MEDKPERYVVLSKMNRTALRQCPVSRLRLVDGRRFIQRLAPAPVLRQGAWLKEPVPVDETGTGSVAGTTAGPRAAGRPGVRSNRAG